MKNSKSLFLRMFISVLLVALTVISLGACGSEKAVKSNKKFKKIGEGENNFYIEIEKEDGKISRYEIFTDSVMVGEALAENNMIKYAETEKGEIYISELDGAKLDYEKTKKFWAVYSQGKYMSSLPTTIDIMCGDVYTFKIQSLGGPNINFPSSKLQKGSNGADDEEEIIDESSEVSDNSKASNDTSSSSKASGSSSASKSSN